VKPRRRRPVDPHLNDRVVTTMVESVPGLSREQATDALTSAQVRPGISLRQIDDYLAERPGAFSDLGDLPPLPLVRLVWTLAEQGHPVARPRCAQCAAVRPDLRHALPVGRVCDRCVKADRSRPCAKCGRVRPIQARTADGGICGNCRAYHPDRQEQCASCGRSRRAARRFADGTVLCNGCYQRPPRTCIDCRNLASVQAITDNGPVCNACYHGHQPRRVCGRCGRDRPIAVRATATNPDICLSCWHGHRAECAICGRSRDGRRYQGAFRCHSCIPRPLRECSRCRQTRTVQALWPMGPVCASCYTTVRNTPQQCAVCGIVRVLTGLSGTGTGVCGPCAGGRDYTCQGCGRPGHLYAHDRCQWCVLDTRVRDLLADTDGRIADQLVPLHAALTDTDRPESVIGWLSNNNGAARLLATLPSHGDTITHDLLDQLAPASGLHYAREILVLAGVLQPRDEYLERVGPWLRHLLAELPTKHAQLLQPFAHWHVLHRARRRAQRTGHHTPLAAQANRDCILAAARFLAWVDASNLVLGRLNQQHLDQWLTTPAGPGPLRRFIQWTNQRKLTQRLNVPPATKSQPSSYLTDEQRWGQLRECLHNTSMPTKIRVAGALILLLGINTSRLIRLTADDITTRDARAATLAIGKHPIELPPRLATLVNRLAADASTPSALRRPDGPLLLFPGRPPTRPQNPSSLGKSLARWGITPHPGRNAALIDLANDLPAPVLADLLGLSPNTAVKWSKITGRDWASYLASRISTTPTEIPNAYQQPQDRTTTNPG
jgi:hypothetical protein